ncbi:hypothetical protein BVX98_07020 [bacterium F11]|nr:hypothetical protein BVX98_07020 [bacterium F11]
MCTPKEKAAAGGKGSGEGKGSGVRYSVVCHFHSFIIYSFNFLSDKESQLQNPSLSIEIKRSEKILVLDQILK